MRYNEGTKGKEKEIKKMTMSEKIAELEAQGYIKNDSYEVYENAAGGWTIQVFTTLWSFEEYNFDKKGNPIDAWETGIGAGSIKIF